jgi:hypothetical protein
VGALRAAAHGHDVSIRSMDQGRHAGAALPTMQGMQDLVQQ